MEESSDLRTGGPDSPNRGSDFDWVGRAGKVVERYKIFYALGLAIVVWWGNNVREPLRSTAETTAATAAEVKLLNKKIDSMIVPRLDSADARTQRMIEIQENQTMILGTLTRLQCLRTSAIDRVKINLDCRNIPIQFPKGGP